MILSAHQSAYNPWLGFIHKILLCDIFVVMDDVQFEKNSFINRNRILQNSNEVMLSIPVETKEYKTKTIRDIKIANSMWKIKHKKSIEQAYKKAPYFERVFGELEKVYAIESDFLIDYTDAYLNFLVDYLKIETQIIHASSLHIESKKLFYVIEMCEKLNAETFIFGALGKEYADEKILNEHGIKHYFQEYKHPTYTQNAKSFHPYMGIIDLLFNEKNPKEILLKNNITKEEVPHE